MFGDLHNFTILLPLLAMLTVFPSNIASRNTSRIDRYGPIILGDNSVVPAWVNVKINIKFTIAFVFAICGASLVPHTLL